MLCSLTAIRYSPIMPLAIKKPDIYIVDFEKVLETHTAAKSVLPYFIRSVTVAITSEVAAESQRSSTGVQLPPLTWEPSGPGQKRAPGKLKTSA